MSIAGIRSNRGDIYQRLVAFDWALTILSDPKYQWLEVDATGYLVDDVVIGKADGSIICCQCKKNQPDFRAWSIADLSDELVKAVKELAKHKRATVRFYSRSEFGSLAKLREYSLSYASEADYIENLTQEHTKTNANLVACIADHSSTISAYEFLYRTSFEISSDFDRMKDYLRERLSRIATSPDIAFSVLNTRLDELGSRVKDNSLSSSAQHRLTKDDLIDILNRSGSMLVPRMDVAELKKSFAYISAIGRSWHRDIAGQRMLKPDCK